MTILLEEAVGKTKRDTAVMFDSMSLKYQVVITTGKRGILATKIMTTCRHPQKKNFELTQSDFPNSRTENSKMSYRYFTSSTGSTSKNGIYISSEAGINVEHRPQPINSYL
ncbi:hypothetical protein ElyMa_005659500 [Elysia marginata]|uniref:Uncharacterized protein n=1 Tax=Elysia marginata TaxID=1093978 RepID=A0AAV4FBT2_9GAST|nr:hypothetical protein ElyMa_005659500 [Elysia marginata]